MTYRFTGSPAVRYLGTHNETDKPQLPKFIAEDELIKHLIAFESIFAHAGGHLSWNFPSCSVICADLMIFNTAIDALLSSIVIGRQNAPQATLSTEYETGFVNLFVDVTTCDKTNFFEGFEHQRFRKLIRSIGATTHLANKESGFVITIKLPSLYQAVDGVHPAERQINQYDLTALARFSVKDANFQPLVLVVEPNQELRSFLTQLLQTNYRVLEATTGVQALQLATCEIPDLIITDVLLQELDGLSLIHQLSVQDSTSHIPVMFLSGIKAPETKIDALMLGAVDYLTKPFIAAELLLKIRNVVQTRYRVVLTNGGRLPVDRLKTALPEREIKFITALEQNVALQFADALLDTSHLASSLAMSERQLQRKLKALLNQTPAEYIREYRLHKAKELLLKGKPVALVADLVGFSSSSHFSRSFKSAFKQSPSEFIQAYAIN